MTLRMNSHLLRNREEFRVSLTYGDHTFTDVVEARSMNEATDLAHEGFKRQFGDLADRWLMAEVVRVKPEASPLPEYKISVERVA